jgi:hypothetical protein
VEPEGRVTNDERDLAAALEDRVRAALEDARLTFDELELLAGLAQQVRERKLLVCCAWCGRFGLGGEWHRPPEMFSWSADLLERASHGICPDCLGELAQAGVPTGLKRRPPP